MAYGTKIQVVCANCGATIEKVLGCVNRANKEGRRLFCNRTCSSATHKSDHRTPEQKKADKAAYDERYRQKQADILKAKKAAYYQKTRNPEKEREKRKERMPLHVEYCRKPEYRKKKHSYDIQRQSAMYGEFAEAHRLLVELEREIIKSTPDKYERLKQRGYFEVQNEKRKLKRAEQRIRDAGRA